MPTNIEIAQTIISQLGGSGKLKAMTGAYNFVAEKNGVSFRLKNPRANYVKITLTSMDLYDLEVGRIRGDKYTVVAEKNGLYNDMLKPAIEEATGMYLSLYGQGGTFAPPINSINKGLIMCLSKNTGCRLTLKRINKTLLISILNRERLSLTSQGSQNTLKKYLTTSPLI